ncbi:hypothetical protein F5B22DRAFT_631257 [Xylaria bambusicola]|uniref:uncharacterized protein n=1 Tax=Xylaria bambusicola TaxID=326684 RepID=UPI0020083517|nr:uncharacterized protein F5B22DRAFT_631257 [Xylaria bambusicola]KAI0502901.1 hypothetical protein F5B22DRAFT_631257 [Xylaria bambusicola]
MPSMDQSEDPPVKSEPLTEPVTPTKNGVIKAEPSGTSSLSHLPSRPAAQATPELAPRSGEEKLGHGHPGEADALERLCNNEAPDTLENAVSVATGFLDQLQDALTTCESPEVDVWNETIVGLQARTAPTRTVVGVVGDTGAGKSSVINALLDEERLLPTNCLRACTASPTEVSFNYSDDPQELYRAEVEFISADDWIRELQILFTDLLDGSGQIARDATKTETDAGIAYAKVKAVYPQKTRDMLAQASPQDLANEPAIRAILGTTKKLAKETAQGLYQGLQHYVDSKEKSTGTVGKKGKPDTSMEYWPLIKVVRIFTKADALSTGAVVVDLPGVQDSNAARAAVAVNYMKSCTGIWVVAPITRAVDNQTAKSLLGDSFKRQLKYDGTYTAVSFICSKADDISNEEASRSLGLEAEFSESWNAAEEMEKTVKSYQARISSIKEKKAMIWQQSEECDNDTDVWEDLETQLSTGDTVYAPSNPKKRHRSVESLENSESRIPLTEDDIEDQLSSLRAKRKQLRKERSLFDAEIIKIKEAIRATQAKRERILEDVRASLIQGRNNYAKGAIKADFATGIKELDQENAVEEDDAAFDPDHDARDYAEIARNLPVFCVSSRAYQKLKGKLERDDFMSYGFQSIEDTEIPKLQEHAKKLTEARRISHCRQFLNDLSQLINSMKLWSANDDTESNLSDSEKDQEEKHLQKLLDQLEEDLQSSLKRSIALIQSSLQEHIFDNIASTTPSAIEAAPNTAYSWGAHRSEGGLFWATYKATVRRQGVYCGASGPRDFNSELFDPISRRLATGWERAFQRCVPRILKAFATEAVDELKQFHQTVKARAEERRNRTAGIATLSSQISAHARTLEALPGAMNEKMTASQREASRSFTPVIQDEMGDAYTICTNEHGTGSYARMKAAMLNHVDTARHTMFDNATDEVKHELGITCRSVMEDICATIDTIFTTITSEYKRTLVGDTSSGMPKILTPDELEMRSRVHKVLLGSNTTFAPILGEPACEVSHNEGAENVELEDSKDMDALIQADIRDQDSTDES